MLHYKHSLLLKKHTSSSFQELIKLFFKNPTTLWCKHSKALSGHARQDSADLEYHKKYDNPREQQSKERWAKPKIYARASAIAVNVSRRLIKKTQKRQEKNPRNTRAWHNLKDQALDDHPLRTQEPLIKAAGCALPSAAKCVICSSQTVLKKRGLPKASATALKTLLSESFIGIPGGLSSIL